MILETINNIIVIFNPHFVITAPSWYIHFYFVKFVHIYRIITYIKY